MTKLDEALLEWATPIQAAMLRAVNETGSYEAASEVLGKTAAGIRSRMSDLRKTAAKRGHAPESDMTKTTPPGFHVRGVSSLYDSAGQLKAQWVKTQADKESRLALLMEAARELAEPFKGLADPVPLAAHSDDDLLCVYPMGDPHLGMFAWGKECGQDFDLAIAERNLVGATDHLVELAPPATRALIINLGDFFHADSSENRTLRSGASLDVDTRWSKVLACGVRTMRRLIDKALEKHAHVTVICEIGNHDDHSAIMLALCLQQYYEREPRVTIDTSPATFHWYRFGECLIGVTHGHNTKAHDLPAIMAHDRKQDWAETSHRLWYTGHVHHDSVKEYTGGVIVETFRTLAPKDAWHTQQGYRSGQDMKCDVLHARYGRVNRHVVGIRQVWERVGKGKKGAKQ